MNVYIALLRGINVGGKNRLPMKELAAILEGVGAQKVRTYIQSGNAVFVHKDADGSTLSARIGKEVGKRHGFEPQVLLLSLDDLDQAIRRNPFPEAEKDPVTLHVGFLAGVPAHPDVKALEAVRGERERFRLVGRVFYLHAPDGIGRSKLAARAERLLGVPMTDRNWKSVVAIRALADGLA
jgi:uncharacterized protein (DUF1697 family)